MSSGSDHRLGRTHCMVKVLRIFTCMMARFRGTSSGEPRGMPNTSVLCPNAGPLTAMSHGSVFE